MNNEIRELRMLIKELRESQKETDKQMKETDRRMKETDRRMKETDRRMKETDRRMKETDRRMKETDRRIGKWIDGWGSFVEGLAAPSIPKIFKKFGVNIIGSYLDATRHKNGKTMEIDILNVGRDSNGKRITVVVEMKSKLTIRDVKKFIKDLDNFLEFFDEYKGSNVIGVVGGGRIERGVVKYAEDNGLCVIGPSGDIMLLLNKEDFTPKIWN